jgi:hypothetical protein
MSDSNITITSGNVKYTDLQRAIADITGGILTEAGVALDAAKEQTAVWATQELRAASMAHGWRHYAKGWDYTTEGGKKARRFIVSNKSHYQLTHLLEKGHRIITKDGRDTGKRAPAFPHIAPVNDRVPDVITKYFEEQLKL